RDRVEGAVALDDDRVRILETRAAPYDGDVVAIELLLDDVALAPPHLGDARQELLQGGTARLHCVAGRLRGPCRLAEAQHRFAERLARDRTGVDAHATDDTTLLDDRGAEPELCSLDGGALPRRSASEAEEVEVVRH